VPLFGISFVVLKLVEKKRDIYMTCDAKKKTIEIACTHEHTFDNKIMVGKIWNIKCTLYYRLYETYHAQYWKVLSYVRINPIYTVCHKK